MHNLSSSNVRKLGNVEILVEGEREKEVSRPRSLYDGEEKEERLREYKKICVPTPNVHSEYRVKDWKI